MGHQGLINTAFCPLLWASPPSSISTSCSKLPPLISKTLLIHSLIYNVSDLELLQVPAQRWGHSSAWWGQPLPHEQRACGVTLVTFVTHIWSIRVPPTLSGLYHMPLPPGSLPGSLQAEASPPVGLSAARRPHLTCSSMQCGV